MADIRKTALNMATSLGIPFFIRDGKISQNGPGEEILPPDWNKEKFIKEHGLGDNIPRHGGKNTNGH